MKYKKFKLIVSLVLICFACLATAVFAATEAQNTLTNLENSAPTELTSRGDLIPLIGAWVKNILALLGVALILIIIYAGIVWGFMAQGEPAKITKARQMIINAIIGLLIVLGAYLIADFVLKMAKGSTGRTANGIMTSISFNG